MDNQDLKEVRIWNIKYNLLTAQEIASVVNTWLKEGRRGIHLTGVDAHVTVLAQTDDLLRRAILDSDIVNVDSFLPAKMLSKKGYNIKDRVTTPDLMEELLKCANSNSQKVYLLGAKEDTVLLLKDKLLLDYPTMKIVGCHSGYFDDDEEQVIINELSIVAPDYLFLGLPSPKKERFILKYKSKIDVGVFLGVGGAFDARAGVMRRPPGVLQRHGLEAVFRVSRNPKVYGNRIKSIIKFYKLAK